MIYGCDWVSYIIDIGSMTKYQNIKIMPNCGNNGFLLLLDGRANVITEFVNNVATCGAGTDYPSRALEFTSGF